MSSKKFLKIVLGISFIVFFTSPFGKIIYIDRNILHLDNKEIIYFSDSVMKSHSPCENNNIGIDDILRNKGLKIKNINHGAYSPIIYENYIKNLPTHSNVIIPINMRSFSEQWFDRPSYKFYDKRMASSILSMDFVSLYKLFYESKISNEQNYLNSLIVREGLNLGTNDSITETNKIIKDFYCVEKFFYVNNQYTNKLSILYKYHYMYDLNLEHKMFVHLDNIINYAKKNNINILFYITPLNFEYGEKIVGKIFEYTVTKNIDLLKEFLQNNKVSFIDMSKNVDGQNFNDHQYVCEHLDFKGRGVVATKIYEYFKNY